MNRPKRIKNLTSLGGVSTPIGNIIELEDIRTISSVFGYEIIMKWEKNRWNGYTREDRRLVPAYLDREAIIKVLLPAAKKLGYELSQFNPIFSNIRTLVENAACKVGYLELKLNTDRTRILRYDIYTTKDDTLIYLKYPLFQTSFSFINKKKAFVELNYECESVSHFLSIRK